MVQSVLRNLLAVTLLTLLAFVPSSAVACTGPPNTTWSCPTSSPYPYTTTTTTTTSPPAVPVPAGPTLEFLQAMERSDPDHSSYLMQALAADGDLAATFHQARQTGSVLEYDLTLYRLVAGAYQELATKALTQTYLPNANGTGFGGFDTQVSLAMLGNDLLAAGAPLSDRMTGFATLLHWDGTALSEVARFTPPAGAPLPGLAHFGVSVALGDGFAVVGAPGSAEVARPLDGVVYTFERVGNGTWGPARTTAQGHLPPYAAFAQRVAARGKTLAVAAPSEGSPGMASHGAVYVFTRATAAEPWTFQQRVVATDQHAYASFGQSLDLDGSTLAVAASSLSPTVDGDAAVAQVRIFERSGATWTQMAAFDGDATPLAHLRSVVAVRGDRVLLGDATYPSGGQLLPIQRIDGTWQAGRTLGMAPRYNNTLPSALAFGPGRVLASDQSISNRGFVTYVYSWVEAVTPETSPCGRESARDPCWSCGSDALEYTSSTSAPPSTSPSVTTTLPPTMTARPVPCLVCPAVEARMAYETTTTGPSTTTTPTTGDVWPTTSSTTTRWTSPYPITTTTSATAAPSCAARCVAATPVDPKMPVHAGDAAADGATCAAPCVGRTVLKMERPANATTATAQASPLPVDVPYAPMDLCLLASHPQVVSVNELALPSKPAVVALPAGIELTYVVDAATKIEADATVAAVADLLPEPVATLPDAVLYLHVEPAPTVPLSHVESVLIEIPIPEGTPPAEANTLTVHYWDGDSWVDLGNGPADGAVQGATDAKDLKVFESGRDLATGKVWAKVSHTSTYALAPGSGAAGSHTVTYAASGTQWLPYVLGGAGIAIVAVLAVMGVVIRRRYN